LLPQGIGYAILTVSKTGAVRLAGVLGDNTRMSRGGTLSKDGRLSIYEGLYRGKQGGIIGRMTFASKPGISDAEGTLHWFKPAATTDKLFPAGFVTTTAVVASRYIAPRRGVFALNGLEGSAGRATVAFSQGNIVPFGKSISISRSHRVAVTSPAEDRLGISISPSAGTIRGSFRLPGARAATAFRGVLLQQSGKGFGLFIGPGQSGKVELAPED
jgi:hypothetical protein